MKTMPSLLAPAGNMRALQTALRFGADAVYCGAKQYGLRAQANNFDEKQLEEAVRLAHAAGAQVNLTLNIFAFDGDLDGMVRTAQRARDIGVDAAIVSDLGAIARIAREVGRDDDAASRFCHGKMPPAAGIPPVKAGKKEKGTAGELALKTSLLRRRNSVSTHL